MRCNVRFRSQGREEAVEVVPRDELFKDFDCFGYSLAILIEFDVVKVEVEYVPIASISAQATDLVLWNVVLIRVSGASVRLETLGRGSQSVEFVSDNLGFGLNLQNPVKFFPVPPAAERHTWH